MTKMHEILSRLFNHMLLPWFEVRVVEGWEITDADEDNHQGLAGLDDRGKFCCPSSPPFYNITMIRSRTAQHALILR